MKSRPSHLFPPALILAVSLVTVMPAWGATVEPFGSPLDAQIVAITVPPTRPENPVIATAREVVQWDDASTTWVSIYTPPWTTAQIRALGSYEKSSKALYVVHGAGISRTGDGGASWVEAVPPGFDGEAPALTVHVDPVERKHAVVASADAVWETTDYGASYLPLPIDGSLGPVLAVHFMPVNEEQSRLIIAQRSGITQFGGTPLREEMTWESGESLSTCYFHPAEPFAFGQVRSGEWKLLYLPQGGDVATRALAYGAGAGPARPLASGSSSLWMTDRRALQLVSLDNPSQPAFKVAELAVVPDSLHLHPRQPDSLYVVGGSQLYRISDSFAGASARFIAPAALAGLQPLARKSAQAAASESVREEQPMDVAIQLSKVLADEPSFEMTLQKVLDNEQANPGQFAGWMRDARKRHWIPELRLIGGVRQLGVTDNLLVSSSDPFGFESLEDYRLPDRVRHLSYFGIVLEWPLAELLFDEELVDISKERRYYFKERRAMIEDLAQVYYGRINRIVEAKGIMGTPTPANLVKLLIEIHQMSQMLNGFCGEALFDPSPVK